jgi:DNA-binding MarR family transcriptional regulator
MYQKFLMNLRTLRMLEARMTPKDSKEKGISYMHLFWLHREALDHPVPISHMRDAFNISASAATQFVNALEKHGLVVRHRNPDDMRSSLIEVSAQGKVIVEAMEREMEQMWLEVTQYLGDEDTNNLYRIIDKMVGYCERREMSYASQKNK